MLLAQMIHIFHLVPDYGVSYLTHVNRRGDAISKKRVKRDEDSRAPIYYKMSLFGMDLHLNLTINKYLLAPDFHIETRHKNGSKTFCDIRNRNFYHGHVVSYPQSTVALSGNDYMVSQITKQRI